MYPTYSTILFPVTFSWPRRSLPRPFSTIGTFPAFLVFLILLCSLTLVCRLVVRGIRVVVLVV